MNFNDLNSLKKQVEEDLLITDENVKDKCLKTPNLFQKYLNHFIKESYLLKQLKLDLQEIEAKKFKHYKEEYNRQLNKGDIEYYVSLEPEYLSKKKQLIEQESICQYLELTVDNFKSLKYGLKSYIDLRMFLGGR